MHVISNVDIVLLDGNLEAWLCPEAVFLDVLMGGMTPQTGV